MVVCGHLVVICGRLLEFCGRLCSFVIFACFNNYKMYLTLEL